MWCGYSLHIKKEAIFREKLDPILVSRVVVTVSVTRKVTTAVLYYFC